MKLCFVGKYPPIEGGVSMTTYWIARGLAERGHQIWLVTNSSEVEPEYRMQLSPEDEAWMEPCFPETGGFVRLRALEPYSRRRMGHIPQTTATVSRLAGAATETIRSHGCDACFAYYLEPYGVAACLAHQRLGVPYVIKHAGSDVDRLMMTPDLAETYVEVFRSAAAVVTRNDLVDRYLRMGVDGERFAVGLGFDMPSVFNPDQPPLDLARVLAAEPGPGNTHIPARLRRQTAPDLTVPTIGIYGKIGETKGTFDLIQALRTVKAHGLRFNLLCMTGGGQFGRLVEAIEGCDLTAETWLLPFLPHWRVPGFIRACTAVCFLERAFPIKIHGPGVPREVMSCGTCLILSGEITEKQQSRLGLRRDETAVVVHDPRDHEALAAALARVIADPAWARAIGRAGHDTLQQQPRSESAAVAYERLFERVVGRRPITGSVGVTMALADGASAPAWRLAAQSLLPRCQRLLEPQWPLWLRAFEAHEQAAGETRNGHASSHIERALAFAIFLKDEGIQRGAIDAGGRDYLADVIEYEIALLRACAHAGTQTEARRANGPFVGSPAALRGLRPAGSPASAVHHARKDLVALDRSLSSGDVPPVTLPAANLDLLIVPQTNYSVKVFSISPAAAALWRLCDGHRTADEIVAEAHQGLLSTAAPGAAAAPVGDAAVHAAMSRLLEMGALTVR